MISRKESSVSNGCLYAGRAVDGISQNQKQKSRRSVPLPEYLLAKLKHYRAVPPEKADKYKNHNLVFASRLGTPFSIRNLDRRHFKPTLERGKLPKIRLYDLRHTCATLLLAAGENPKIVGRTPRAFENKHDA